MVAVEAASYHSLVAQLLVAGAVASNMLMICMASLKLLLYTAMYTATVLLLMHTHSQQ
jgi:hypothetical protein